MGRRSVWTSACGLAPVLCTAVVAVGCGSDRSPAPPTGVTVATPAALATEPLPSLRDETALLDSVFRIDVDTIEATFDVYPAESRVRVQASVAFRMRPGQSRAVVHFEPARSAPDVALRLDGESLDVRRPGDARIFTYEGSGQASLELLRELSPSTLHRLEASCALALPDPARRFFTDVNDIQGRGNEVLFPTLNTPHELARHVIALRVHAAEPYLAVGSGNVSRRAASSDVQEWLLDTERPVASYTVMFHLAPAASHTLSERRLRGVDVRVLAPTGGAGAEQAFADLDPWLDELRSALGPFPMPRGLSVVLTQAGGGMEYYGATTTSLRALRHEVFHMYFGTSTVARSYRDSWWDEAIDMWYELSADPSFAAIADSYRSDIVNGRSAAAVGFDTRAYLEGARVFQAVAAGLGGREPMIRFLRDLHARRSFDPFTTWQLADELQRWSGLSYHDRFRLWLYQGRNASAARGASPLEWLHRVDTRLP